MLWIGYFAVINCLSVHSYSNKYQLICDLIVNKSSKTTESVTDPLLAFGLPGPVQYRKKYLSVAKPVEAIGTSLWLTI